MFEQMFRRHYHAAEKKNLCNNVANILEIFLYFRFEFGIFSLISESQNLVIIFNWIRYIRIVALEEIPTNYIATMTQK